MGKILEHPTVLKSKSQETTSQRETAKACGTIKAIVRQLEIGS